VSFVRKRVSLQRNLLRNPVSHTRNLFNKLIGRKNATTEVHDFDHLLPDQSVIESAVVSQSHQTQANDSPSEEKRAIDVHTVDLSSDDDEVENLLEPWHLTCQALEDAQTNSVPSFNPLSSSPVRGSSG
jgi:hypothetical protein